MCLPRFAHHPLSDLLLLFLAAMLFFGALLGGRPYSAPSESRYVEIGREMAESGNYVTPRLNYIKYFEKPPLFYWVQAAWTKVAGTGLFVSRVPTAFFASLLCLLTYGLGRMLYGRLAGWLSALVIATSLYLFSLSRIVLLDVPVSVFLVATMMAFLYAALFPTSPKRLWAIYGMYIAAAGAVMTKGLIGALLPGAIFFLWLFFTGRWAMLAGMRLFSGTLLFLALTVPWHIVVWLHNPEHPHFYFIHEHLERYTSKVHGRYQPFWFFAVVLVAGLFPWIAFAPAALRNGLAGFWHNRKQDGVGLFLFLWMAFIFLFFSASDSKLIPYILPIFPPLAALIGRYFSQLWEEVPILGQKGKGFTFAWVATIIMLLVIAVAPIAFPHVIDPTSKIAAALARSEDDIQYLSLYAMLSIILLFIVRVQGRIRHSICALLLVAAGTIQLGDYVASNYSKDSMTEIATVIKRFQHPGDEVAVYDNYYQDLPVYLNHRVSIVHWWKTEKSELRFGAEHEDTSSWMIDYDEFWKRWLTPEHPMFAVMREEAYDRIKADRKLNDQQAASTLHLYPMVRDGNNILFINYIPPDLQKGKP